MASKLKQLIIDALPTKTIKISFIAIYIALFPLNASVFNTYAQSTATGGGGGAGGAANATSNPNTTTTIVVKPNIIINNDVSGMAATSKPASPSRSPSAAPSLPTPSFPSLPTPSFPSLPTPSFPSLPPQRAAAIFSVWAEHNLLAPDGLQKGMIIHANFNVLGMQGRVGQVTAYFLFANGQPLNAAPFSRYSSQNGQVAVGQNIFPGDENTNYFDFRLFMPYSALNMAPGSGTATLEFFVQIWDNSSFPHHVLANSPWNTFTYTCCSSY